jgi:hypothetical protein
MVIALDCTVTGGKNATLAAFGNPRWRLCHFSRFHVKGFRQWLETPHAALVYFAVVWGLVLLGWALWS